VCRFVHGEEGLAQALKATEALRPGAATALDAATLEAIAGDAPSCSLSVGQVTDIPLVDVMVASGMLKSKGEVRLCVHSSAVIVYVVWPSAFFQECWSCIATAQHQCRKYVLVRTSPVLTACGTVCRSSA